ncbi:hypothetical protein G647_09400 [Cladophialophora carrionii CBS 160.54]|uniref:Zn(2)-C6 fungal-type domain-containing protein n=1 Tax=Cladophialophora carrionii CBS 160.54 TaxID=1279043 RepID=V9CYV5_9EURO|nr:uncharacterized protein G647_09400 [Cladophialophora carrionii CBS 160.54]ETI19566.1 hypothetical protein G647_09400 [Cladophialophora carrionii CBS 160.54]
MAPSSKTVKPKSAATVRSRTGCQTCRQRKLKCDEQRPICGQCQKSHRECVRSEPITFRHHQNSSFGKDGQDHNLDSFFKYSQTYSEEDKKAFLPVPEDLTWVYVSDPNAEDPNAASPPTHAQTTSDTYQQVAAHTLEALSTAAADHTTSYPPQGTAYYTAANPQSESHPEYGFMQGGPPGAANGDTPGNIGYFLGNSASRNQTDTSLIDPNLESTVNSAAERTDEEPDRRDGKSHVAGEAQKDHEENLAEESRLAITLKNFNELLA